MPGVHRNIRLLYLHNFCEDFRPYQVIAILFFAEITGSFALGMLIHSCVMISSAVFELPTGVMSDLMGRKKTMILGSIASFFGLLLFAFANSLWMLIAGAVLQGLSRSFFSGNTEALLHDSLREMGREEDYAEVSGRARSMYQLALSISAIIGAVVAPWSFRWTVWVAVAAQLASVIVSMFFVEPRAHSHESTNVYAHVTEAFTLFFRNAKIRVLSMGSVIWNGLGETIFYFEPIFIGAIWPVWGIGVARTMDHALGWMSYWYAGRVIRRLGTMNTLLSALCLSIVLGLLAFIYPTIFSPAILVLTAIPYGLIIISQDTLMQQEFSTKQRATMGSLNSLLGSIFFGICAVLMGWIADAWSPITALLLAQIGLIVVLPLYWHARPRNIE